MDRPQSIACLFLFAFAGLAGNVAQGAPAVLTIGFDVGSPPFFDLKNGCPSGIYPLLVGAIFRDAGLPMLAYPAPFSRVLVKTDAGEWGAGGILKTPDRVARYDFSDAIYTERILVYFNKTRSRPINTLADLEAKRIGVVRGWSYGKAFDELGAGKFFFLEPVNADVINFKKLQIGRIDALLVLKDVGLNLTSSGEFTDLAIADIAIPSSQTYIAFSKKSGNAELLRRLNKSINKLQTSGHLSELIKQYLKTAGRTQPGRSVVEPPKHVTDQPANANCLW